MKIALMGSSSKIAIELNHLLHKKHDVTNWSSTNKNGNYFSILDNFDLQKIENEDLIIYFSWLSYPRTKKIASENIKSFKIISDYANQKKIKLIFISSLSAKKYSKSTYGYSKYQCETIAFKNNQSIISFGTIVNGGMFIGTLEYLENIKEKLPIGIKLRSDLNIPIVSLKTVSNFINLFVEDNKSGYVKIPYKLIKINQIIFRKKFINLNLSNELLDTGLKILSKFNLRLKSINDSWINLKEFNEVNSVKLLHD